MDSSHHPPTSSRDPAQQVAGFDWIVLIAAILCAVVCALGLNTMLQCVFQCASRVLTQPQQWIASRRLNSGLKRKEMVALPTSTYCHSAVATTASSSNNNNNNNNNNCVICLGEFCDGEKIRFLPNCNHYFHVVCIDKWLLSHSSCPTCRHLLKSSDHHSVHHSTISIVIA